MTSLSTEMKCCYRNITLRSTKNYLILEVFTLGKLSDCQKERHRTLPWSGNFVPECDKDGKYNPRQCFGGQCWCVTSHGHEIHGTRSNGQTDCSKQPVPGLYREWSTFRALILE